jgi:hypothetical protein
MKTYYGSLLLLVGACAFGAGHEADLAPAAVPEPKPPAARRTFETLVNTYPKSVEAAEAQNVLDAALLFEDGQARLLAGKYGTASLAFQTLIAVYPESPLVPRAAEAARAAEALEQAQSKAPIVRSLRFEKMPGVKVQEILQRFQEREIELAVEKPFDTTLAERAKSVLTELLAEKGMANPQVQVITREIPPRSIEVVFRAGKN